MIVLLDSLCLALFKRSSAVSYYAAATLAFLIIACKIFCENIKLTGASVIIPGVNDGEVLRDTCNNLEDWGAKGFILMRFANTFDEGLILGNEPIIKGIESQPVEEFAELVKQINKEYSFRVSGTPLCDPETGGPFAIAKDENEIFIMQ